MSTISRITGLPVTFNFSGPPKDEVLAAADPARIEAAYRAADRGHRVYGSFGDRHTQWANYWAHWWAAYRDYVPAAG